MSSGRRKTRPAWWTGRLRLWFAPGARALWRSRLITICAFVFMTGALTHFPKRDTLPAEEIERAPIADREIRAVFEFQTTDLSATQAAQDAAAVQVTDHYRVDWSIVQRQLEVLRNRCGLIQSQREVLAKRLSEVLKESVVDEPAEARIAKTVATFAAQLKKRPDWKDMPDEAGLAIWLMPDPAQFAEQRGAGLIDGDGEGNFLGRPGKILFVNSDILAELSQEALGYVLAKGVRSSRIRASEENKTIHLTEGGAADEGVASHEIVLSAVPDPSQAGDALGAYLIESAKRAARGAERSEDWAMLYEAALSMTRPLVAETIHFDNEGTAEARQHARETVPEARKTVYAGQIIQDRGKPWTAQSRLDVKTFLRMLKEEPAQRVPALLLAHALMVGLVLTCLRRVMWLLRRRNAAERLHYHLSLLLLCVLLGAGRIASYFEHTGLIMPVAAVGILAAILMTGRLATMVAVLASVVVSIQYNYDWRLLVVGLAMSLAGVFSIFQVRRRSDMAAASLKAAGAGLIAALALSLALDSMQDQAPLWNLFFSEAFQQRMLLIALNGVLCLMLVPAALSPLERFFGITTDIQLLEFSDLNNELLSQLARKAGATYSHSQIVGQMAGAAAEAIGANGLLAKVCSYYHDIGKMRRSEYFSENQTGYNIHDELPPKLSARAIAAHVTQGAQLAREYHLPKPIIDGILEHHGTGLIGFFYQQAKEQQKHGEVAEEDFRYPGPKPQRPETAILMICDAVESGVRSFRNPNEARVREFVDKIIASRVADRQFDECNLTLKQLDTVAAVVVKQVMTNLHTRVAYPEFKEESRVGNVVAMPGKP